MIYYAGTVLKRDTSVFRFVARPMPELDDEEGYYKVTIDEHILYRY